MKGPIYEMFHLCNLFFYELSYHDMSISINRMSSYTFIFSKYNSSYSNRLECIINELLDETYKIRITDFNSNCQLFVRFLRVWIFSNQIRFNAFSVFSLVAIVFGSIHFRKT